MGRAFKVSVIFGGILGLAFSAQVALAVDFPKPAGYVNDFARVLTAETKARLESTLGAFETKTSTEISVAIVNDFQGLDSFSYSQALFTDWAIGKKELNNGVLFLIGPKFGQAFPAHGDAFINVGKGLEGALTDITSGSILRNDVFPSFKAGDFDGGVVKGVAAIMAAVQGEYTADTSGSSGSDGIAKLVGQFGPFLFWFGVMILSWLSAFLGRSESWWLGGILGGVVCLVFGFIFFTGLTIIFTAVIGAVAGLIFDYIVSKNYAYRIKHGLPTDFRRSMGGFWFWGGGGRGGFGGGGFSGFGGGGSGGGGAGGGW